MDYTGYKMDFSNGVHFGNNTLEGSDSIFHADTLFSALCHEAKKNGEDIFNRFISWAKEGTILFSDAMPYCAEDLYIPKPMVKIDYEEQGDSTVKKAFKKLSYIPVEKFEEYMMGKLDIEEESNRLTKLGVGYSRNMASIRGKQEAEPYRVGVYHFNEGNGLYIIIGHEGEESKMLVEDLLDQLSLSGIGGKRTSGLGRFELKSCKLPENMKSRLKGEGDLYMSLSVSLPAEQEMEQVLEHATYQMIKRSGFVVSADYADEYLRKKDLFVMNAGACFSGKFLGDIYDVSSFGNHPVYRYAKPLLMEVGI